ncbi:MAG TPA: glycosyl hydrolase 115 family protein [Verrucomicrobiae bacterium]|nr:glycosyl hydrolase 115 family protein [Verrucomicrobiae bacterium]
MQNSTGPFSPALRLLTLFKIAAAVSFTAPAADAPRASSQRVQPADFPLVASNHAAVIVIDEADAKVVRIAAALLAADIQSVTGLLPLVTNDIPESASSLVVIGTIGSCRHVDDLVSRQKFDMEGIRGGWERFKIGTVEQPFPGVAKALVIAGSDRRGAAYGVVSLSESMGVSPWHWWSDVTPSPRTNVFVSADSFVSREPSVRYRGFFINDEDWGLQPWAARTFEGGSNEVKDIGPKTYAKVFELLLRLKANTLWPAMHACTKPFNYYPANRQLADDYAIVMGSSHAEPMLRNNVGEWTAPPAEYNYQTHSNQVREYWETRVRENGRFENIYTLGMRGIHDSRMQGPRGRGEQVQLLQQIFSDQRALLARHVSSDVDSVPQVFCAYKEVLDVYRGGLKVPDDVTIMFPDDNFGYIRTFATAQERQRRGGAGVYYHISYLGRPLSYLWLCTTPPALIWAEMTRAYEHGAQRMWIVNVGDIKPAEIGTEFFLKLAWDVQQWREDTVNQFLAGWAAREFGQDAAPETAAIMEQFYRLNHQRKPEHLQWWLPNEEPRPSPWSNRVIAERLAAFDDLVERVEALARRIPKSKHDAFFQLVRYPVAGSALANRRYFLGERGLSEAERADAELRELTRVYNEEIAGGKWHGFMRLEPADNEWRGMRISRWQSRQWRSLDFTNEPTSAPIVIEAEQFSTQRKGPSGEWRTIGGLGPSGDSVSLFPVTAPSVPLTNVSTHAPRLTYGLEMKFAGEVDVTVWLVPTFPVSGSTLRIAMAAGDETPRVLEAARRDGTAEWSAGVLNAAVPVKTRLTVPQPGRTPLHLYGIDPGVVVDRIEVQLLQDNQP